jgi:hypothetical protein
MPEHEVTPDSITMAPRPPYATTARNVEAADLVRVDGDRLYVLSVARGLLAFDVSDIDHPRELWHGVIAGNPVGLFIRKDIAIVVIAADVGSDHGSRLCALDVSSPDAAVLRTDVNLPGTVLDVHAIDDVLYVLSEDSHSGSEPSSAVTSFRVNGDRIEPVGMIRVAGAGASFAVGATKVLVARSSGSSATDLTFGDVGPEGALDIEGSLRVRGTLPVGFEPQFDPADRFVRVITCLLPECGRRSGLVLSVVDALDPRAPRRTAELSIPAVRGSPVAVFDRDHLYVAGNPGYALGDGTSEVQIIDLAPAGGPRILASLQMPGSVSNVIPLADRALAIASRGTPATSVHVVMHVIDLTAGRRPEVVGSVEFGEDWTSSLVAASPQSAAFGGTDNQWLALPFGTWNADRRRYANGIEILRRAPHGYATAGAVLASGWVERVLFLRDRFVGVGNSGLTVVDALPLHGSDSSAWNEGPHPGERDPHEMAPQSRH